MASFAEIPSEPCFEQQQLFRVSSRYVRLKIAVPVLLDNIGAGKKDFRPGGCIDDTKKMF